MPNIPLVSPAVAAPSLLRATFLHADDQAIALRSGEDVLTYGELRARIAERAGELDARDLGHRPVVVVEAARDIGFVVDYLALLEAGHVPLLAGPHVDRLVDVWRPAAVLRAGGHVERLCRETRTVHPDLALLLSTSGSTGSPKLVRLSAANVTSNAGAIAAFLGLGPDDCGITSLPLHYCYGLSVLHAHLAAGASVVLTEASVVDPCFEAALRDHGVSNVAGVPHTFDLLERAGVERLHTPRLRLLTQAGGRLEPAAVVRWLDRAESWGAEFVVMYGQTEATARMAYLPPAIARRRPAAIGVPIPGGSLRLRPLGGDAGVVETGVVDGDVGELVYRGPNVMLGYATSDDDLAAGRTVDELATGDLARFHPDDGVFELVGRAHRFVKPFGLRVDLDEVERRLAAEERAAVEVAVAGDDHRLVVAAPGADAAVVRRRITALTGVPEGIVHVADVPAVPRTDRGKVDQATLLALAPPSGPAVPSDPRDGQERSVADVYRRVLGSAEVAPTSTFVSLGGDSLSYVECSIRLEERLGRLPSDWHLLPVAELDARTRARRRLGARLDTTVALRAVGILAVVATHMHLVFFPGGAHLLLAVVGYNLSRFQLPIEPTRARVLAGLRTVGRVAVPTMLWVVAGMVVVGAYSVGTLALVNNYVGPQTHRDDHWHFWFIEVFVHLVLLTTLLLAVPAVRRLDGCHPYLFPLGLFLASLTLRMEWAQLDDWYNLRYRTHGVAWFFLLGWLVHRSRTPAQRVLTSALCILTIPGFFDRPQREWFIAAGLVALVWFRDVPVPRVVSRVVGALAAASLWILITHFTVWPPLDDAFDRRVAYVLTVAVGVATWFVLGRLAGAWRRIGHARAGFAEPAARVAHGAWTTMADRLLRRPCPNRVAADAPT